MNAVQASKRSQCRLKVKIQLISWIVDATSKKVIHDIKEQDIFFADVPVMADLYEENGNLSLEI